MGGLAHEDASKGSCENRKHDRKQLGFVSLSIARGSKRWDSCSCSSPSVLDVGDGKSSEIAAVLPFERGMQSTAISAESGM